MPAGLGVPAAAATGRSRFSCSAYHPPQPKRAIRAAPIAASQSITDADLSSSSEEPSTHLASMSGPSATKVVKFRDPVETIEAT